MEKIKMALVGASGLVGKEVLKNLQEEGLADKLELTLYADKSAGKKISFNGKKYPLLELDEKSMPTFDIAIFSAGEEVSKIWAPKFASLGAYVIDNSNAFRREKDIPLVVPEINAQEITKNSKIIANPNCSTIQLVLVLERLLKLAKIKKVIVSTYQSVSGAGSEALDDLKNGTKHVLKMGIKDNLVAQIGDFLDSGYCLEEDKLMFESKKILNAKFDICASVVRVPISRCHGESVYIKFNKALNIEEIKSALECDYIKYSDTPFYPTECAGTNLTYVCRLRAHSPNEIVMFILADNLRRGASYNAVKIAEYIIQNHIKMRKVF